MPEKILIVTVEEQPQILPELGRILADAHVNIESLTVSPGRDAYRVLMIVNDPDRAFDALRNDGFVVERVTGLTLLLNDQPGEFARIVQDIVGVGVDVTCAVTTRGGHVVLGVDDYDKAADAAGGTAGVARETGGASGPPAT